MIVLVTSEMIISGTSRSISENKYRNSGANISALHLKCKTLTVKKKKKESLLLLQAGMKLFLFTAKIFCISVHTNSLFSCPMPSSAN